MRGKGMFELWKQYFTELMDETEEVFAKGATLEQARKWVAAALVPTFTGKFPETFRRMS
jgi:hypothetical protein